MSRQADLFVSNVLFAVIVGGGGAALLGWLFGLGGNAMLFLFIGCLFGAYFWIVNLQNNEEAERRRK